MTKHVQILHICLILSLPLLAQQTPIKGGMAPDTTLKKVQKVILPILYYSPETRLAFGVGGQLFFWTRGSDRSTRPSDFYLLGTFTQERQLSLSLRPRIYFNNEKYLFEGEIKIRENRYRFWGIGNKTPDANEEDYMETIGQLTLAGYLRLPRFFNIGLQYSYFQYKTREVEEGGLLDIGPIPGKEGTTISGIGAVFNLDSRDNRYSPFRGSFMQLEAHWLGRWLGSTDPHVNLILDLRHYFQAGERSILAVQVYLQSLYGDVPFQAAARFGGGVNGRGYYRGRFMDDHLYTLQAEYRLRLGKRWKVAAFVLGGEVAPSPLNFFDQVKMGAGGGVRFQPLKNNEAAIRFDIAFNRSGGIGYYLGLNEAF